MTAVLEVDTVSKTFTRTQALAGVSMTIEPGEVHALLGQNGSGKSTLIKILSGYHAPDPGGGIRIQGNELPFQAPMQSYRLGCRFVQQDLGLVATLSVEDNMSLGSGFPTAWGTIRDTGEPRAGQSGPGEAEPRHRPEGDGLHPRRLGADRRRHRACAARGPRVPALPARPRRADRDVARRRGGPPARSRRRDRGHGRRRAVRDPPPRRGVPRRPEGLGVPRRQGGRRGPGRRLRPCLDRRSCSPARSCSPRRARPGARRPRVRRPASTRRCSRSPISTPARRAASRWRPSAARSSASRGWPAQAATPCSARPSARCRATGGEVKVAGKPLPSSRPDVAIGQGVAYVAPDRKTGGGVMTMSARENLTLPDLKPFWKGGIVRRKAEKTRDQGVVRAAVGAPGERHGGAAQHLQRRQPAEDPVREMAVPEAVRLPAGRADPGRGRRRQERPAP